MHRRQLILAAVLGGLALGAGCGSKQKQQTAAVSHQAPKPGKSRSTQPDGVEASAVDEDGRTTMSFDPIYFDLDSAELGHEARERLAAIARHLERSPAERLTIEGHCDERGTSEYNIALGERRADAIRAYLSRLGIDRSRLSTISFGKERPAAAGDNEEAWARNRRGAFVRK